MAWVPCVRCLHAVLEWKPRYSNGKIVPRPPCELKAGSTSSKCTPCLEENKDCKKLRGSGLRAFLVLDKLPSGFAKVARKDQAKVEAAMEEAKRYLQQAKGQSVNPGITAAMASAKNSAATDAVLRAAAIAHTELMIDIASDIKFIAKCQHARLPDEQKDMLKPGRSIGPVCLPPLLEYYKENEYFDPEEEENSEDSEKEEPEEEDSDEDGQKEK
ncbi:hypothetical protein B0I35DRAFT_478243 [Stachybotrys elegans]|uniref:Uncharacterized protein n=1 Tax=Stachybotrys elegans TaxID=80388 RepID=A0A8K0SSS9_9HYPO|nr:hypothetical protein B0I35DRAFT_478243 [Stachybotrys elegans]